MTYSRFTLPPNDDKLHLIEDHVTAAPANLMFQIEESNDQTTILPLGATSPSGAINFSISYRLTVPANAVYRITYHYGWSGHNNRYIGVYDEQRDIHQPMYKYTGGSGYGSRHFSLPAHSESLDYILHGHEKRYAGPSMPIGGWKQVPGALQTGSNNTVVFTPDEGSSIGWISWGVLTTS